MPGDFVYLDVFYLLDKKHHREAAKLMGVAVIQWLQHNGMAHCVEKKAPLNSAMPVEIYFHSGGDQSLGIHFSHADENVADSGLVAELIAVLQKRFAGKNGLPFVFSYCGDAGKGEFWGGAYAVLPDGTIFHCDPEVAVLGRANAALLKQKNAASRRKKGSHESKEVRSNCR